MMIHLKCQNDECGYSYEITESELKEYGQYHTNCLICKSKMKVTNLDEIAMFDCEKKAKENIDKWVREYGWDYVIDLVKKYKDTYAVGRLYVDELRKRGFNIKEE